MCGLKLKIFVGNYLAVTKKCCSFAVVLTRKLSKTNNFAVKGGFIVGHSY